jgi:beta-N-acetylhexosaminidase
MSGASSRRGGGASWQPGQLLFAGFDGTTCPPALGELIARGRIGGVVLFARNVVDAAQLRRLVGELHAHAPHDAPLLVAIDQEGGRVQRLRAPWTEWPPMRRLGEVAAAAGGDSAATAAVATALARELGDCGIALDFAPVVDVDSNPANPVIGDRSFGSDPERVAAQASTFVAAMQGAGVACCAKHFPGHGDTALDSHLALPAIDHGLDRLRTVELPPFAAAITAGVASIMTAHVVFRALDPLRPATFSPEVIGLLRERLRFDGVVFSDDLEMKAVADRWQPHEMVDAALTAGVDALLVCQRFDVVSAVLARLESVADARLEAALSRVAALKRRFARPHPAAHDAAASGPPYPRHQALAARLARGA